MKNQMVSRVLLGVLGLAGIGLVGARAAAAVDQNITVPFSDVVNNPCTGEDVVIEGEQHIVSHTTTPQPGKFIVGMHTNTHGTGVAVGSGTEYVFNSNDNFHEKFTEPDGAFSFQDESSLKLISQGSADNFVVHVVQHMTMNANGEITSDFIHMSGGCKG